MSPDFDSEVATTSLRVSLMCPVCYTVHICILCGVTHSTVLRVHWTTSVMCCFIFSLAGKNANENSLSVS